MARISEYEVTVKYVVNVQADSKDMAIGVVLEQIRTETPEPLIAVWKKV